jgi:tetratricopeptide (TPR) repeat protein
MQKILISFIISLAILNSVSAYNYYESGRDFYRKGNYWQANKLFKKELEKNPQNIKCRYIYAQSFVALNSLKSAQREYEKVIELAPGSEPAKLSAVALSRIHEYYNPTAQKTVAASGKKQSTVNLADNYIKNAQYNGKIIHWNLSKMPVKVYIENAVNVEGYQTYYYYMAQSAVATWIKASEQNTLSATFVNNPEDANITIRFVPQIANGTSNNTYLIGLATPKIQGYTMNTCDVQIRAANLTGASYSQTEIFSTILHELGHAFGLWGHSTKVSDIMYDNDSGKSPNVYKGLSRRDVNTLKILYWLDPDISNFSSDEKPVLNSAKNNAILGNFAQRMGNKYYEALDYVKKYPDQAISWTNLGTVYSGASQHKEAIECYSKALSIDPSYTAARNAIAIAYSKLGDNNTAASHFAYLVQQDPQNKDFSYNLAVCLSKANRNTEAFNVLNNLIRNNPAAADDPNVKNLMQSISR